MSNAAPLKRTLLLAAALGLTAVATPARADWGQEDGDAARTGYAGGTLNPVAQPLWSMDYNPFNGGAFKAPAAGAGRLFLAVGRNGASTPPPELRAFNLFTGQSLWTTPAPTSYTPRDVTDATYANNRVYLQTMGHSDQTTPLAGTAPNIYSFDPRTGARTLLGQHTAQTGEDTRVTVNDDFVFADTGYYGGTGGRDLRVLFTNGWARTEIDNGDTHLGDLNYNRFSTAANNSTIYLYRGYRQGAGAPYGRLVGMDERTGATVLDYTLPGTYYPARTANITSGNAYLALGSTDNALLDYVQGSTNYLASIGLTGGGSEQWRTPLDTNLTRRIAVANGVVFAQTSNLTDAYVYALSEATGKILWTWTLPQGTFGSNGVSGPLIVTDNRLLVSSTSPYVGSNVYSIDIPTGTGGVYIPGQSALALSDGVLLTRGPGGYDGGKLNAYRVASTLTATLTPLVDGRIQFQTGASNAIDGEASPTVRRQDVTFDDGVLEFDLAALPQGARITSMTLTLDTVLVSGQLGLDGGLQIFGYHGDGLLNDDATPAISILGTATNPSGTAPLTISLDPDAALALAGPDGLLGLRLWLWGGLEQYAFSALESDRPAPELAIAYSVPEPTTAATLLTLLGLAATARRHRRPAR
jgi:outer membrane protein assembly factor BamB